MTFVAIDKGLRIITGGAGHDHSHGHGHVHAHSEGADTTTALSSAVESKDAKGATSRKKATTAVNGAIVPAEPERPAANKEIKLGG